MIQKKTLADNMRSGLNEYLVAFSKIEREDFWHYMEYKKDENKRPDLYEARKKSSKVPFSVILMILADSLGIADITS